MNQEKKYLAYTEFVPHFVKGRTVRINHEDDYCVGNSKSIMVKEDENGAITAYCFRCGKSGIWSNGKQRAKHTKKTNGLSIPSNGEPDKTICLPRDSTRIHSEWTKEARDWVTRYGITEEETERYGLCYSSFLRRVIIPTYLDGKLSGYQTRKIYDDDKYPKYYSKGTKSNIHIGGKEVGTIIIVEDILSGIKVARQYNTLVLLGTNIDNNILSNIINIYNIYIIYLDNDNKVVKNKQSKLKHRLELLGKEVFIIKNNKDPKEIEDIDIKNLIEVVV